MSSRDVRCAARTSGAKDCEFFSVVVLLCYNSSLQVYYVVSPDGSAVGRPYNRHSEPNTYRCNTFIALNSDL